MEARFLAKKEVVKAFPTASIKEVAKLMVENRIGLVVLISPEDEKKVVGVVSERDVVRAVVEGISPDENVDKIATHNVITCDVSDSISEVARKMMEYKIRHIVITEKGNLYGVVSIRDLISEMNALSAIRASETWIWDEGMTT